MSLGLDKWQPPPKDSTRRIIFSWLYDHLEKLSVLGKFMRTQRALSEGHALYDETDDRLDELKLFRPLPFNLYQSSLSAAPGIVLTTVLGFLLVPEGIADSSSPAIGLLEQRAVRLYEKLSPAFVAFAAPLALLLLARMAAWSSLRPEYRSPATLFRHRRAYLYYDAHHGFIPEAVLSLLMSAQTFAINHAAVIEQHHLVGMSLGMISRFLLLASIVQLVITCSVVPSRLFELVGYSDTIHSFASGFEWKGSPPKGQYFFWTAIIGSLLVVILNFALQIVAFMVAFVGAWLQGITSGTG